MKELMQSLREASLKAISETDTPESVEALRVRYLGKKGELTSILRQMGKLSAEERPVMGQLANQLRGDIESAIEKRRAELSRVMLQKKLELEAIDVTLPAKDVRIGHKHPMYNVLDQLSKNQSFFKKRKLFINAIPSSFLSDSDWTQLMTDYGELMENHIREMRQICAPFARYNDKDKMLTFRNGSTIKFDEIIGDSLWTADLDLYFKDCRSGLCSDKLPPLHVTGRLRYWVPDSER